MQLSPEQFQRLAKDADKKFLAELEADLAKAEPAFLPRFAKSARGQIVRNLHARALQAGATSARSITLLARLMVGIAPNITSDPAVRAWLANTSQTPDEAIPWLAERLTEADWERIDDNRRDLVAFIPPAADELPLVDRVALALPVVLWDLVNAHATPALATSALRAAEQLGFNGLDDAPVAVASWRLLYGRAFADAALNWPQDVRDAGEPPATRLAMLRARIMLDHGRWAGRARSANSFRA
ncbi:hypothetical protein BurJ1DRAFT_0618 [Burkholderiales bacterium JOSHI_001]|nr:hypothetical protein BurJ1DRAFT_0618 [Burkholderiales bacterium JOSHI_001]